MNRVEMCVDMQLDRFNVSEGSLCSCLPKYSLNTYLGKCGHNCLYCYSVKFPPYQGPLEPKLSLLDNIDHMAANTEEKIPVMISPATDPYQPIEKSHKITRKCIQTLISNNFPILIVTKSSLVTRDIDILKQGKVAVAMTITTINDEKARTIEPKASPSSERLTALKTLTDSGITVLARIDPIIPTFTDDETELKTLIKALVNCKVKHITTSTLKPVKGFFTSLKQTNPELANKLSPLYKDGDWRNGYKYLPKQQRRLIIEKIGELVVNEGLTFGSCREGFEDLNTSICDGTEYIRSP